MQTAQIHASKSFDTIAGAHWVEKINYPGSQNYSQFTFDPMGRNVKLVEVFGGSTTSTRQFIWDQPSDLSASDSVEERDGAGTKVNEFFDEGERPAGSDRFYSFDHLASCREMTDSTGVVKAQYKFGLFGGTEKTGSESSVFTFTGLFAHDRSQLLFAPGRPYSSALARWISRDPAGEGEFSNLFCYVENDPINYFDPTGYGKQKGDRSGGRAKGKGKNKGKINPDCKTISCCYNMYDRCRYRTAWHYFMHKSLGGYETDYAGSMRCCRERLNDCFAAVRTGKGYPKSRFDCPNECLHSPAKPGSSSGGGSNGGGSSGGGSGGGGSNGGGSGGGHLQEAVQVMNQLKQLRQTLGDGLGGE